MSRPWLAQRIVRVIASASAAAVACLFSVYYSALRGMSVEADIFGCYKEGQLDPVLPPLTRLFHTAGWWIFSVPAGVVILGILCLLLGEKRGWAVAIATSLGWLFALAWSLACIVAWEMPLIRLVPVVAETKT
jgi:hypothetical protein